MSWCRRVPDSEQPSRHVDTVDVGGSNRSWSKAPLSHGQVYVHGSGFADFGYAQMLTSPCSSKLISAHRVAKPVFRALSRVRLKKQSSTNDFAERSVASIMSSLGALGATEPLCVGLPRQSDRPHGVGLFSIDGELRFVKWSDKPAGLQHEFNVLKKLDGGSSALRVPRGVHLNVDSSVPFMVTSAMPVGRHVPAAFVPWKQLDEMAHRLDESTSRDGVTSWAHGDCSPWNTRTVSGQTWLIDWADAFLAPANFDRVYFWMCCDALGLAHNVEIASVDMTDNLFDALHEVVDERIRRDGGSGLDAKMMNALVGLRE